MSAAEALAARLAPAASPERITEALYAFGHALLEAERFDDALPVLRTMLRAAPADERAWIGLARCHEGIAEPTKALRLLVLASTACPASARAHLARGRLLATLGQAAEAAEAFETARTAAEELGDDALVAALDAEREAP